MEIVVLNSNQTFIPLVLPGLPDESKAGLAATVHNLFFALDCKVSDKLANFRELLVDEADFNFP